MGRRIILASGSPRRKELLALIEPKFEVIVSDCDENTNEILPQKMVMELSEKKAEAVLDSIDDYENEIVVIGSDTVVSIDGMVLGKPKDEKDAFRMLHLLSGRGHEVYTGVCILCRKPGFSDKANSKIKKDVFFQETKVIFNELSDEEIHEYILTGEPSDKAGAYGIQGYGSRYINEIQGNYSNVVGLPVAELYKHLKTI